ncbi:MULTISPECIES: winged helix-turn-helix domain-containing protein [Enterococcus]|uniref:OmpR/PhoB-type domain-containing protein n=1 Tax=Candidatus Enterococcus ferrettii TaxID=2815324 RepID=A0ABV0ER27_9ENTE|nr:helix-turn-helix domain-containing protein [Enterococcus sp. 665A]MBO1341031.1 winged helix-turn-helix domain-containing protein [Enterococcus sp. 665A]
MGSILVLTKNLLVEQQLQEQLQRLNYEVYCSTEFLDQLLMGNAIDPIFPIYQAVILSETISNQEIQQILEHLLSQNRAVLRKFASDPSAKEKEQLKLIGIHDYLVEGNTLDQLREQLVEKLGTVGCYPHKTDLIHQMKKRNLRDIKIKFSKMEKKTLQRLTESQGESVSRQEMCEALWNDVPNNSHLSQLSLLIKRVKHKLEKGGFEEEAIETIWGYGYRLSPDILEEINRVNEMRNVEELKEVAIEEY